MDTLNPQFWLYFIKPSRIWVETIRIWYSLSRKKTICCILRKSTLTFPVPIFFSRFLFQNCWEIILWQCDWFRCRFLVFRPDPVQQKKILKHLVWRVDPAKFYPCVDQTITNWHVKHKTLNPKAEYDYGARHWFGELTWGNLILFLK